MTKEEILFTCKIQDKTIGVTYSMLSKDAQWKWDNGLKDSLEQNFQYSFKINPEPEPAIDFNSIKDVELVEDNN